MVANPMKPDQKPIPETYTAFKKLLILPFFTGKQDKTINAGRKINAAAIKRTKAGAQRIFLIIYGITTSSLTIRSSVKAASALSVICSLSRRYLSSDNKTFRSTLLVE
jgi:hypothetical protein